MATRGITEKIRLEGLHGLHTSMSTLMLEAEKADVEDAPTLLE